MKELVAFFDGRRQISNVELEPVITLRANQKGCLFSYFFDDVIEVFIRHIRLVSGGLSKKVIIASLGGGVCDNFPPIGCATKKCGRVSSFQ